MDKDELKKLIKRMTDDILIGCCYVYAQRWGDAPYRFYFPIFGMKRMRRCVAEMKARGFTVDIWRPS